MDSPLGLTVTATTGTTVTVAEADFVESAALTAVAVTVAGKGAIDGAEYTALNPLVDSDPQAAPLQPAPLTFQVTAVLDVPVTLALKVCVPAVTTEAFVGLRLNKTATAATIVTLAEADLLGSATLLALTVTDGGEGTLIGATYKPLAEIVPHAAPVQPEPLTVHVTALFAVPVTLALKACVPRVTTDALAGLRFNETTLEVAIVTLADADLLGSAALLALTVTDGGDGAVIGATYNPVVEIVPHAAPAQPKPLIVHVTALLEVPVKLAEKARVLPAASVRLPGFTVTATGVAVIVSVAVLLVTMPNELVTTNANWALLVSGGVV